MESIVREGAWCLQVVEPEDIRARLVLLRALSFLAPTAPWGAGGSGGQSRRVRLPAVPPYRRAIRQGTRFRAPEDSAVQVVESAPAARVQR
jgi:hypothetical protein